MRGPLARLDDERLILVTGVDTSTNPITENPPEARTSADEGKNWSKPVPLGRGQGREGRRQARAGRADDVQCDSADVRGRSDRGWDGAVETHMGCSAPGLLWIRMWWPGGLQVQALERDLVGS